MMWWRDWPPAALYYLPKPIRAKEALARIRTHLQIRHLLAEQQLLVEELSKANAAKNKLLGMAAHDLRNPLASIRDWPIPARWRRWANSRPTNSTSWKTIHSASKQMLVL